MESTPREEISQRINRFQKELVTNDLEGAFILQNADLFYFSGTIQSAVLFVPANGVPILMVQKNLKRAQQESSLANVIAVESKNQIARTLRSFGVNSLSAAGLEMDVLPASLYIGFKERFPRCRWVDVSPIIRKLRMIKTDYEIEQIQKSTAILHTGLTEIRHIIREGMTELEIDGYLAMIARREGHMGVLRMRGWNQEMTHAHVLAGENGSIISMLNSAHGGSGNTPAMAQGAGFRRIGKNEPIGIDYGVAVNGYIGDQFRTYVIGTLSDRLEKAHECSCHIHLRLAREAKPGVSCSHLYNLALEMAAENGYSDFFMGYGEGQVQFVGHGIGLEIDEYPVISPRYDGILEEGMVFALEPMFVLPQEGIVGLEDDYLVTSNGLQRLTHTEQAVIYI